MKARGRCFLSTSPSLLFYVCLIVFLELECSFSLYRISFEVSLWLFVFNTETE